jgi:hypothetical protein
MTFNTIVFSQAELDYWCDEARRPRTQPSPSGVFFPTLVGLRSELEEHTVLLRLPVGQLVISAREPNWEEALQKALRETLQDLSADTSANIAARTLMIKFIGTPQTSTAPARGVYSIPLASEYDHFQSLARHNFGYRGPLSAAHAVAQGAVIGLHRRTVGSAIGAPERALPPRPPPALAPAIAPPARAPAAMPPTFTPVVSPRVLAQAISPALDSPSPAAAAQLQLLHLSAL